MAIDLVYPNGDRVDLRFVNGLTIRLSDIPPEIAAEFAEINHWRQRWSEYLSQSLGIPAQYIYGDREERP